MASMNEFEDVDPSLLILTFESDEVFDEEADEGRRDGDFLHENSDEIEASTEMLCRLRVSFKRSMRVVSTPHEVANDEKGSS